MNSYAVLMTGISCMAAAFFNEIWAGLVLQFFIHNGKIKKI